MKLTGPACIETLNEAEKSEPRDMKPDRAGWVRVEPTVRPSPGLVNPELAAVLDLSLIG